MGGVMIMDESSCVEVEEEQCGFCHTVHMEECSMKMVEEMMPAKVSVCRNVTKYQSSCATVMNETMVEEEGPICRIEMVSRNHTDCEGKIDADVEKTEDGCRPMLECKIGIKKEMKKYP